MSQISESLNSAHKKSDFSCGKGMLDNYLHKQANQDIKRKLLLERKPKKPNVKYLFTSYFKSTEIRSSVIV